MIRVLRPNLASDSTFIKVVSYGALNIAQWGPYQIDPVMERFGGFVENIALSAIAVDNQENVYIFETLSISGEEFCMDSETKSSVELTSVSEVTIYFYYQTLSDVTREGLLTKKNQ